jgi:RNA recognition motif-containing protein
MNQRRDDAKQQHDDQLCTLFLQNIPEDYSEADIKTHIQDYKFRRVNIVRRDGESIGKAFIELESTEETQGCLEAINGQKWGYCVIEVQLSKPKPKPTDDESKSSKPKSKSKPKPNSSSSSNFKKPKPRSAGRH